MVLCGVAFVCGMGHNASYGVGMGVGAVCGES